MVVEEEKNDLSRSLLRKKTGLMNSLIQRQDEEEVQALE
jgi:hypothetical protein